MMVRELSGRYAEVYNNWKSVNASSLDSQEAACEAAKIICTDYELPANTAGQAIVRAENAKSIYLEMIS